MDCELPSDFDLIVVGTGVVESMVSAAASRIGKTVLHVDTKDYYGGVWGSFNLEGLQTFISKEDSNTCAVDTDGIEIGSDEQVIGVGNDRFNIIDKHQEWILPGKNELISTNEVNVDSDEEIVEIKVNEETGNELKAENEDLWSQEKLLKQSRRFNIDISPKIQFARGEFVELLISSNIARYSEYRSVSRILTKINNRLEEVPCSRSDVFSNNKVTVVEKRMLMKLLNACLNDDANEFRGYENKTFLQYLNDKKLTNNVIMYVLHGIAFGTKDTSCVDGVKNVKRFISSLGRFGKTPFLYSMYGSGELSQAFCRLSAVFGGIYALNQKLNGFVIDKLTNKFKKVICGKQTITARHIVMGVDRSPVEFVKNLEPSYIARGIFVTKKSILESKKEHLSLLMYPLEDKMCYIVEMGTLTGTCPKDINLVHMFTRKGELSAYDELKQPAEKLFNETKDDILWYCCYSTPDTNRLNLDVNTPENVFLCPGPDVDLDIDGSIKKAKDIFNKMYPGCEFLPRAPDPEELIIGEEDEVEDKEVSAEKSQNDLKQVEEAKIVEDN